MGYFKTPLDIRIGGDRNFMVLSPLEYHANDGAVYTVPKGQWTDLASVWYLPFISEILAGRANRAATLHDYFYRTGSVSRLKADQLLKEAAMDEGESEEIATILYLGVRAGGKSAYKGKPEWNS